MDADPRPAGTDHHEIVRTERLRAAPVPARRRRRGLPRLPGPRDPAVARPPCPSPYTREDAAEFVTEDIAPERRGAGAACPCVDRGRRRARRLGGAHYLRAGRLGPEIGYWIAPWARRKGYAAEAARGAGGLGARARRAARAPVRRRRTTPPPRPSRVRAGFAARAPSGRAWSTGTAPGATRCSSGGWPGTDRPAREGAAYRALPRRGQAGAAASCAAVAACAGPVPFCGTSVSRIRP